MGDKRHHELRVILAGLVSLVACVAAPAAAALGPDAPGPLASLSRPLPAAPPAASSLAASVQDPSPSRGLSPPDPDLASPYFGARYYGSKIGRFTTGDPVYTWRDNLVDPQRWIRYAYARDNPLRYVDPNGQQAAEAIRQLGQQAQGFPDQRVVAIGGALIIVAANIDKVGDIGQAIIESGAFSGSQPLYPGVDIGLDQKMAGISFSKNQGGDKGSTLSPGPYAGDSIPARGPQRDFKPGERGDVNQIGGTEGCHTCGKTSPGTKSGNFVGVPDHQPPTGVNRTNAPQRLYPQCIDCSRKQGGEVSAAVRKEKCAQYLNHVSVGSSLTESVHVLLEYLVPPRCPDRLAVARCHLLCDDQAAVRRQAKPSFAVVAFPKRMEEPVFRTRAGVLKDRQSGSMVVPLRSTSFLAKRGGDPDLLRGGSSPARPPRTVTTRTDGQTHCGHGPAFPPRWLRRQSGSLSFRGTSRSGSAGVLTSWLLRTEAALLSYPTGTPRRRSSQQPGGQRASCFRSSTPHTENLASCSGWSLPPSNTYAICAPLMSFLMHQPPTSSTHRAAQ